LKNAPEVVEEGHRAQGIICFETVINFHKKSPILGELHVYSNSQPVLGKIGKKNDFL
jgi:hypothetical protein